MRPASACPVAYCVGPHRRTARTNSAKANAAAVRARPPPRLNVETAELVHCVGDNLKDRVLGAAVLVGMLRQAER